MPETHSHGEINLMPSEYASLGLDDKVDGMAFDEFGPIAFAKMAKSLQDILGDIPPRQKTFKLEDSWKDLVEALERRMQWQQACKAFLEAYGKNLP